MDKETLTIKITRRDKIYISIIAGLFLAILVLAICLPRPYKTVEVEKQVIVTKEVEVYPTKKAYIINRHSALFDDVNQNYILNEKEYLTSTSFEYIDLDSLESGQVSVIIDDRTLIYSLKNELLLQIVQKQNSSFETKIVFSDVLMNAVKLMLEAQDVDLAINQEFLFELTFENSKLNFIVGYIAEKG